MELTREYEDLLEVGIVLPMPVLRERCAVYKAGPPRGSVFFVQLI